jgi:hypothetical protein
LPGRNLLIQHELVATNSTLFNICRQSSYWSKRTQISRFSQTKSPM